MIPLSPTQVEQYALPLIRQTMESELGNRAAEQFAECVDPCDLWGLWDGDILTCVTGLGCEISPKKIWLGWLAVNPAYRRKGLATRCLDFAEAEMKSRGYKWCLVETYEHPTFTGAAELYKRRGYVKIGELVGYLEDDSDALYMRKRIG